MEKDMNGKIVMKPNDVRKQFPHLAKKHSELLDRAESEDLMIGLLFWEASSGALGASLVPVMWKDNEWKLI